MDQDYFEDLAELVWESGGMHTPERLVALDELHGTVIVG
jgi:hypothetical protein